MIGVSLALSLLLASAVETRFVHSAKAQQNAPQPIPLKVTTKNVGGAFELDFETLLYGNVKLFLPDDMAAGDTISGTVVAEPKGNTPEERAKNRDTLEGLVVEIGDQKVPVSKGMFTWLPSNTQPSTPPRYMIRIVDVIPNKEVASTTIPVLPSPSNVVRPQVITPTDFKLPTLAQQGRAVEVFGPFDGNSSNTGLTADFEKGTENVSSGFGLLAESPRKAVFRAPSNVTGPVGINLKEGIIETKGMIRVVDVHLTAPKTNLKKGEQTSLTVEVNGLEGIKTPIPLQLDARGVITMDGGNFQNVLIPPTGLQPGGRFVMTRTITGQQAGAFSVVATVIVRPYDVSITDDSDRYKGILWSTFTGNYIFTNHGPTGPPRPPSGTAPPGGTLTGTGRPVMKGCILTLTHNAPDRRVFSRLDVCTNSGDATIQTKSPKSEVKITDTNTADNASPTGR